MSKKGLGRGLDSLIRQKQPEPGPPPSSGLFQVEVGSIVASPHQPRKEFDPEKLLELTRSITAKGLIQPVIVRPLGGGKYELIAGERRWRAAKQAGLTKIPAVVRTAEAHEAMELALIENIQRQDLNPIETAQAYQQMVETYDLSHDEIAQRVGKDRTSITNLLRLLQLPAEIQGDVASGSLSMGHARAILAVQGREAQLAARKTVLTRGLSVRETERLTKKLGKPARIPKGSEQTNDIHIKQLEDSLRRSLGTKVAIRHHGTKGVIELHYFSSEELDSLINHLRGKELP